ncbi:MAG: ParA family protein [Ruminococcus sp.]
MEKNNKTAIKIAVSNQKGGCGKTTTVMNLGAALAVRDRKVLLVDFDPQHHLSAWVGVSTDGKPTAAELIYNTIANQPINHKDYIRHSIVENFDIIPATNLLAGMLGIIAADSDSPNVITRIFNNDFFNQNYDYIIFDCQTALDLLVTNVLKCCDKLLIPVQADLLSYGGVEQMLDTFMRVKAEPNIKKYLLGMLVTMYVTNTKHSAQVFTALKDSYGSLVFDTYISFRTEAKNAVGYQHSSVSDLHSAVGAQYIDIANKVMEVCENV